MALEVAPDDQSAIDGILREAHTMKGAAGMVGMMRVSRLAHRLEDLLVELRSGTRRSTPELTDSMLLVVDGLGRLIASPASAEQDASDELAMERLLPTPVAAASTPTVPAAATARAIPASPPPAPATILPTPSVEPMATESKAVEHKKLESATLDVPVARIDELNRLVGEVSAAQLRVGHVFGTELSMDPDRITEYRELTKVINQLQEVTERTRMVPIGTLSAILHRTARDMGADRRRHRGRPGRPGAARFASPSPGPQLDRARG